MIGADWGWLETWFKVCLFDDGKDGGDVFFEVNKVEDGLFVGTKVQWCPFEEGWVDVGLFIADCSLDEVVDANWTLDDKAEDWCPFEDVVIEVWLFDEDKDCWPLDDVVIEVWLFDDDKECCPLDEYEIVKYSSDEAIIAFCRGSDVMTCSFSAVIFGSDFLTIL